MVKKYNWNVLGRGEIHSEYKHVEGERKEVHTVIVRQPYSLQWNLILYLLLRLVSQRGRPASLKWMLSMGNGVWGNWSDMKWIQRRAWGEGSGVILRRFRQKHNTSFLCSIWQLRNTELDDAHVSTYNDTVSFCFFLKGPSTHYWEIIEPLISEVQKSKISK